MVRIPGLRRSLKTPETRAKKHPKIVDLRPTTMGICLALVSAVFSDLRRPEIRTIHGTENHPHFLSQFLEGAKISKSSRNWRQF